jgi:hypothetical protein
VPRAWIVCGVLAIASVAAADTREDRARAEQVCLARDPTCDWVAALSSLERLTVVHALTARGYTVEPSPWGKVVGAIRVYNEDVFPEQNRVLQFFNHFHVTTKEFAIAREVVISPGEVWDQARVEETARRLRDPLWSSVVVVLPVASSEPGKVDVLVVTRDVWSLRLNTKYTVQQGSLTNLSVALSENNFLGTRTVFAAGFLMDQGAVATGPIFINRNLLGKRLSLSARVDLIFNRDDLIGDRTFTREGSQSSISVSRPLFSLASQWGTGVSFSHRNAIERSFQGLDLFQVDCINTVDGRCVAAEPGAPDTIGFQYAIKRWNVAASAVRQWGTKIKHQVSIGHRVDDQHREPLGSFPGDATERQAFINSLPRSELTSTPFITYGLFTPTFKTLRNVSTYELAEDTRLGPDFDVAYAVGAKILGSDVNFQTGSWSLGWAFPWCRDGVVRPSVGMSTRYQNIDRDGDGTKQHEFIDNTASASFRVVTPTYKIASIVALMSVATRWNDTVSSAFGSFSIGSDNGLRGFQINQFRGQRLASGQFEVRTVARLFWRVAVGSVLFYDVGSAALTFKEMQLHHDVGAGLRMLIPQNGRDVFRFDLAIPLDGNARGTPRFIAAFESAF